MPTPLDDLNGSSLLAVFAHPDDESLACGGLLARCAEYGARVSLLCLTHGEHGPGHGGERLRDIRAGELADAARVLGIRDLVLLDHEDGMLPWIDSARLEADILGAIHRFHPHVVVTFDEDGLYWHPDHIAVHERTTAVVAELGTTGPALRYVSMPAGRMRAIVDGASNDSGCGDGPPRPILGVADADAFGWMAPAPTLVVEAEEFAGRKLAALRCHRTQLDGSALVYLSGRDAARLLGTEHYRRAEVGSRDDVFIELFGTPITVRGGR
jgi:N-acetyl-1-D-myo-inositol-2-amino-2-deoxy-alpha-D-glucopyranoside deacetylase